MARKGKMLVGERREARQAEPEAARLEWVNAIGYEGEVPAVAWQGLTAALDVLRGMLRASIEENRKELRLALAPTNEGYTWVCDVFVPATDVAAEQIGAHVGCEVVERGWGYAWRRVGAAKDAYGAWARWVDGYKTKYERVVTEMATFGALLEYRGPEGVRNLLFDDGDSFEAVVQAAVVLREAARVEQALADAAEAGDDLKVAEVLGALRDRCVDFLVHGHFRKRSSSGASNLVAIIDGEMRGRIADMAGALVTDLRGKAR